MNKFFALLLLFTAATCPHTRLQATGEGAAEERGLVYFSADSGRTWFNASKGLPSASTIGTGAVASSSETLMMATKRNGIFIYDFKRGVWTSLAFPAERTRSSAGCIAFYGDDIYVGTEEDGILFSSDGGKSWVAKNAGLRNLTIRRFAEIGGKLYIGTNGGLYSLNGTQDSWELESDDQLQVNAATEFDGAIYIATNKGAFTAERGSRAWQAVMRHHTLHSISSADGAIFAMTYNELFSSIDGGKSWKSIQMGLPLNLYTFGVIGHEGEFFAGQWDGVYRKAKEDFVWQFAGAGLPLNFATLNLTSHNGLLIVTSGERKQTPALP